MCSRRNWTAGAIAEGNGLGCRFPVSNVQVAPRRDDEEDGVEDYLGPRVDQGSASAPSPIHAASRSLTLRICSPTLSTGIVVHVSCEEPKM